MRRIADRSCVSFWIRLMRYVSFASGSSGNCGLLRGGGVSLLVDAGISLKRIRACLADEGMELGEHLFLHSGMLGKKQSSPFLNLPF